MELLIQNEVENRLKRFTPICPIAEIPDGRGITRFIDDKMIALFREGDRVFALSGRCTHEGAPLGRGRIENGEVVCPLHHWKFSLETGACSTFPGRDVERYECDIREGIVWIKI